MRQTFKDDFAKSAFSGSGINTIITGKYGVIQQLEDGMYDIWFVGPELSPLGGRRLGALARNPSLEGRLNVLTGEAYTQVATAEDVRLIAPLVGVRKKRKISQAEKERLASMRKSGGKQ